MLWRHRAEIERKFAFAPDSFKMNKTSFGDLLAQEEV
jgi:hypothetical protein